MPAHPVPAMSVTDAIAGPTGPHCPRCGEKLARAEGGGYEHDLVPPPGDPCAGAPTLPAAAVGYIARQAELERLRGFAAAVQAALLAPGLTDLARLASITVAHARLHETQREPRS